MEHARPLLRMNRMNNENTLSEMNSRTVSLGKLALFCYAQIVMALASVVFGIIGKETVIPTCYFAVLNLLVAALISEKKYKAGDE